MSDSQLPSTENTRRDFVKKTSATAAAGAAVSFPSVTFGQEDDKKLKIGLIGCGGRGTGAIAQALMADDKTELWAMGDLYEEKAMLQLRQLARGNRAAAAKAAPDLNSRIFGGLDSYEKVMDSGIDVALLCTPPGFRPQHFQAAVDRDLHVFVEKPCATDVAGINAFLKTGEQAKEKGLSVLCGFCYRYSDSARALFERNHGGDIGDIVSVHSTYYAGPVKTMPAPDTRPDGMSDTEWQLKNWYNFTWLSGDGLVEQGCHNVDRLAWAFNDADPIAAYGSGGRQRPNNEGNIYDHFSVTFEYPNEVKAHVEWRQFAPPSYNFTGDTFVGTKGIAKYGTSSAAITGENAWTYRKPRTPRNMYQIEHDEFFAAIRKGERKDDENWVAHSTLMAIHGRNACYTGKRIEWADIVASEEKLVPDTIAMDGELPIRPVPIPGVAETQNA
ncbi:MAG: Gfo/Idh/MocA family oxidoreductase [Verrucomicrobiales bacterium]|nr:Gfo/Idh/MocA family oxidoreductase [Verrucomicrobiales bacterium]